jgi:7,8-dihydropterin-6-yl-methyl-4-(beta-D-ribofuranosyl)aminobenzene 5'-phosphate synthase
MKFTILYDNEARRGFKEGHGFSCLVEGQKNILVDTGWDGHLLLSNMEKIGIKVKDVDSIFLSHNHWDHIGGLPTILARACYLNKNLEVFYPKWFSKNLKREVNARADLKETSIAARIANDTYTTGELGNDIKEQSLIVKSEKGNIIVTGCAHPGLDFIIKKSRQFGQIYGVIGGFHGFDQYDILKGIHIIVPCHCTQHKTEIKKLYPHNCEIGYAGKIIEI